MCEAGNASCCLSGLAATLLEGAEITWPWWSCQLARVPLLAQLLQPLCLAAAFCSYLLSANGAK